MTGSSHLEKQTVKTNVIYLKIACNRSMYASIAHNTTYLYVVITLYYVTACF